MFTTGSHSSTLSRCAITGNSATGGGGLTSRTQVTLDITNCTIDGNTATDVGAGFNTNGIINLYNSTVTDNSSTSDAPNGGAGLNTFAGGNFRLWNTLVAGNQVAAGNVLRNCGCTGGCSGTLNEFLSQATNLEDGNSCGFSGSGDLSDTDPQLRPLDIYRGPTASRPPLPGSPAIDAGSDSGPINFTCPETDQRGEPRPVDGDGDGTAACDIGAVELDPNVNLDELFSDDFESDDSTDGNG